MKEELPGGTEDPSGLEGDGLEAALCGVLEHGQGQDLLVEVQSDLSSHLLREILQNLDVNGGKECQ